MRTNRRNSPAPATHDTPVIQTPYAQALDFLAGEWEKMRLEIKGIVDAEGDSEDEDVSRQLYYAEQLGEYLKEVARRQNQRVAGQDALLQRVKGLRSTQ